MRRLALFSFMVLLVGCESQQKGIHKAGYVPAAQQCVTVTDPNCTGKATVGAQLPLPEARDKAKPVSESSRILGQCEMFVVGEKKARPCEGIKLMARATHDNEERAAVFDGASFTFENLSQPIYKLEAASPMYDLTTDTKELSPGQTVKIRLRAKPRK